MRFCAFLRGVNVNGTSMKMAEVCQIFENAGMTGVSSVLASGNILFSSEKSADDLKNTLEKAMSEHFNYDAFMFIKNEDEVQHIIRNLPFSADASKHIYVFIGKDGVEKQLEEEFKKTPADGERAKIVHSDFFWQTPKGSTVKSDFGKILGNKRYKHLVTSRNINTIEKILQKI